MTMGRRKLALLLALALCLVSCGARTPTLPSAAPEKGTLEGLSRRPGASLGPNVWTDWSGLDPYEPPEPLFTRYHGAYTDHLIPRPDYGPLVPFPGQAYEDPWGDTMYAYGLATAEGQVVVDPVYADVYDVSYYDYGEGRQKILPVLALLTAPSSEAVRYRFAARDGSWVLEEEYTNYEGLDPETFWVQDEDYHCRVYRTDGTLLSEYDIDLEVFPLEEGSSWLGERGNSVWFLITPEWRGEPRPSSTRTLNPYTGESVLLEGISDIKWLGSGLLPAQDSASGLWGYLEGDLSRGPVWALPPVYIYVESFRWGCAEVTGEDGCRVIDPAGETILVPNGGSLHYSTWKGGEPLFLVVDYDRDSTLITEAYDKDWTPVDGLTYTWLADMDNNGDLLLRVESGHCRWAGEEESFPVGVNVWLTRAGDCLVGNTNQSAALLDRHGQELIPVGRYTTYRETTDPVTGQCWIVAEPAWEKGGPSLLLDRTGKPLFPFTNEETYYGVQVRNGLLQYREGDLCVLRRLDGETVLRWPLTGVSD